MVRRAFNMLSILKLESDLSVPYVRDGIGTLFRFLNGTGCQGFAGPLPSAFLDKQIKNYPKDRPATQISKNYFS